MAMTHLDFYDFILRFQISFHFHWKDMSNTWDSVKPYFWHLEYSVARRFFQLSFRCLEVWLNTILVVFRVYIIKSRFKAANRFSVKQAGPGQDKLSLKTYRVKAN